MHYIAAAVYVSCQELTTSLPEGNDACTRNEVNFTCTIRGSPNLTALILSWSSLEYIGQGDTLQFASENMPGTNFSSVINENVTAILTSNTMMDGVPVLVSDLRIISANQNSMIKCDSITNEGSNSTNFIVPGTYYTNAHINNVSNIYLLYACPIDHIIENVNFMVGFPNKLLL